jgi:predicted  nucleic acid-binding Zn-ribbon protein
LKKRILTIFICLLTCGVLALTGCTGTTNTSTTTTASTSLSVINQMQSDIATLQADVAEIQESVNNINVTDYSGDITSLHNQIIALQSNLTTLQNSFSSLSSSVNVLTSNTNDSKITELQNSVATLSNLVTNLTSTINTIEADIAALQATTTTSIDYSADIEELQGDVTAVYSLINGINTELDNFENKLDTLYNNDLYLQNKLESIQLVLSTVTANNTIGAVSISRFVQGSVYATFTVNKGGNYAVVITLYGTNVDLPIITIPSSYGISIKSDKVYGGDNSMRVLILEPNQSITTSSTATYTNNANWVTGTVIELDFAYNSGVISYISIATANR